MSQYPSAPPPGQSHSLPFVQNNANTAFNISSNNAIMGSNFQPGTAAVSTSVLELSLSAKNLRDMDTFSKSDPMCVVFIKPFGGRDFVELARTECIQNTLNPKWTTKVKISYLFEEQQHMRFAVYDLDSRSRSLDDHDFIGSCEVTLGQVVTSGTAAIDLLNHNAGRMTGEPSIVESISCFVDMGSIRNGNTIESLKTIIILKVCQFGIEP